MLLEAKEAVVIGKVVMNFVANNLHRFGTYEVKRWSGRDLPTGKSPTILDRRDSISVLDRKTFRRFPLPLPKDAADVTLSTAHFIPLFFGYNNRHDLTAN